MLAEGNTLLADGRVQHPDGTIEAAHVCDYPHYSSGGIMLEPDAKASGTNPLQINGWLESVSVETSTSYNEISATWTVPPAPTSNDGQLLYFFPGFEDANYVVSILQPVMQWGTGYGGGGAYWTVASWNCCPSGTTWYSPLIDINVGDSMLGTITPTCKKGKKNCSTWNVVSKDVTTGKKTTLANTPAEGQIWNWAFGAVTEDYGLVQCSDFPDNSGLTFTVKLYDQNGKLIKDPAWVGTQWISNPDPNCNYGTVETKNKETVEWTN